MFDEENVFAASAAIIVILSAVTVALLAKKRCRRFWIRPSLLARERYSTTDFMKDLILDDADLLSLEYRSGAGFKNFFRMSSSTFEQLLNMTASKITKMDTNMREAIPAHERFGVTSRFLASGDSYHSLQYTLKISKQVISKIVPQVCNALVEALKEYIRVSQK